MPLTCCRNGPSTAPTKVSRPSAGLTEQENKYCQISILENLKTFPLKIRSFLAAGKLHIIVQTAIYKMKILIVQKTHSSGSLDGYLVHKGVYAKYAFRNDFFG